MAAGAGMRKQSEVGKDTPPFYLDATGRKLADLVGANWQRIYRIAELVTGDEQIAQKMTGCVFYNDVGQQPARRWEKTDIDRCIVKRLQRMYPDLGELAGGEQEPEISSARGAHDLSKAALIAMLQKLPVTERTIFVLFHSFEYPAAEIASLMLMPEADVRQGAYAALLMARDVLAKR